jgi:hypothetical protein
MPKKETEAVKAEETPSVKGFTSAPAADQLKPTEREVFLLETLWTWRQTSARSTTVLGQPLGC